MLQLVSTGQMLASNFTRSIQRVVSSLGSLFTVRVLRLSLILLAVVGGVAHAQDVTMPTVEIDGVDSDASGDQIMLGTFKFIGRIVLWILIVVAAVIGITRILKSWNAQKNNDEGRWGAVISDVAGSTVLIVMIIALCTWALTFLA